MMSSRFSFARPLPPAATPLSSAFSSQIGRIHPLGNFLAIISAVSGMVLILAFGF